MPSPQRRSAGRPREKKKKRRKKKNGQLNAAAFREKTIDDFDGPHLKKRKRRSRRWSFSRERCGLQPGREGKEGRISSSGRPGVRKKEEHGPKLEAVRTRLLCTEKRRGGKMAYPPIYRVATTVRSKPGEKGGGEKAPDAMIYRTGKKKSTVPLQGGDHQS